MLGSSNFSSPLHEHRHDTVLVQNQALSVSHRHLLLIERSRCPEGPEKIACMSASALSAGPRPTHSPGLAVDSSSRAARRWQCRDERDFESSRSSGLKEIGGDIVWAARRPVPRNQRMTQLGICAWTCHLIGTIECGNGHRAIQGIVARPLEDLEVAGRVDLVDRAIKEGPPVSGAIDNRGLTEA